MLAFDTETTGIQLLNGCTTFSIGMYDGSSFRDSTVDIDPFTRCRVTQHPKSLRRHFDSADLLVAHNASFDIKALCEAGLYSWDEPNDPAFWDRIVDTTHLAHLYCSTDELGLDKLTRRYLGRDYLSETEMVTTVNKCRGLTRLKRFKPVYGDWCIAEHDGNHPSFKAHKRNNEWNRMDYWLPMAVAKHIPEHFRPDLPTKRLESVTRKYLQDDCINTYELAEFYFYELTERHGDDLERLLAVNRSIQHVIWKMEISGVYCRPKELSNAIAACEHYIELLSERCHRLSGLDKITDYTLRDLFFTQWGLEPVQTTKGGQPSVNAATILKLHSDADKGSDAHQFLGCWLSLKKYQKKLQSLMLYRDSRDRSGHLHSNYNSTGTNTTRFSSTNPNLQQVTKAGNPYEEDAPDIARWLRASPSMRSCFGPPDGYWYIDCDYSQLQLRIFAYLSKEQKLIDALLDGQDFHDFVARELFRIPKGQSPSKAQRRIAKNCVFGILFGASEKKIDATAGTKGMYRLLLSLFPNAHAFIEDTKQIINDQGYVVTLGDYPLALKDYLNKHTGRMEKAAHAGVNYIVQGAEGIIVKRAMRLCDDYFTSEYPEGRLALQCHDEIVFQVPAKVPKKRVFDLTDLMQQAAAEYGIHAPVEAEVCFKSWDKGIKVAKDKGTKICL
jgi:DNA polymerase I-like protein with 3'-5' exonuclease and polymerase domains